ncbi:hypothetical protein [Sporosarcina sp. NCCP-2222]|uniref:hypothetical protein n=1 Tax=Sporosarcina sp. NCCP-2222 TaxID=2935073 RepID=UPI0020C00AE2|nr:hypothetical protein [Sporosarcina sp. NCCP-2222]
MFGSIYYYLFVLILINSVAIFFFKERMKTVLYLLFSSLFLLFIFSQMLFQEGLLADRYNASGDPVSVTLFIVISIIFMASAVYYFVRFSRKKTTTDQ